MSERVNDRVGGFMLVQRRDWIAVRPEACLAF